MINSTQEPTRNNNADRQRLRRYRAKLGLRCYQIELPEFDISEGLIVEKLLDDSSALNHASVCRALEKLVLQRLKIP